MESKNLLTLAITLTLGIILAGSLLMPVIADAQLTIDPKVTYSNSDNSGSDYRYGPVDSVHLVIDADGATLNGELIERATNPIVLFESDNISVNLPNSDNTATMEAYYNNSTTGGSVFGGTLELTAENGEITAVFGPNTLTFTYTWMVSITEDGKFINHQSDGNKIYYTDPNNVIICGGLYTTGDNDTYYSWYNGVGTDNGSYTISLNPNGALQEGTTDIYTTTLPRIVIDDENFTPYRMLIAAEVTGHEAGAGYALLGAIPVLVIIGLVLAATAAIMVKRND